ncbi:DNA repair protein [Marinobacter zhejiangensis]|uniref:DNA repair protein n=1 Tax=Marinobacter zhejiangensis TaxID=488535 RepID=A0A1I4NHI2_9GAMM|nr:DNA repair protein [Marinobacter zhejiangensis]SFM14633.1 hypothetical protein SAMN04487963_1383 [Marinobacter zhejiangensis]
MGSAGQASEGYAAVFFMDGKKIARQMRASEFGAFLDGYVGLSDLKETDVKAIYVSLTDDLQIQGMVFFRIYFDEEGRADSSWNIPIEQLSLTGGKGPNLGNGPIHLACKSQCPIPGIKDELWDPDMTPGNNTFQVIRKAIDSNTLKFKKKEPTPQTGDDEIPVLGAAVVPVLEAESEAEQELKAERTRMANLLREHRLRIKTLQSVHRDALADTRHEHRIEVKAVRSELTELEQKYERLRIANEQLKQRLAERNEQYLMMQEQVSQENEQPEEPSLASSAEAVLLNEQIERKQRELELRDEKLVLLEQELHELRHREPTENTVMRHLQDQSVFLVGYHPGIGHLTLPYEDIEVYFQNPTAYAADKCGLNEPAYRDWLDHYENPVCRHQGSDGVACEQPVMRVSQPAEFRPGVDDRCDEHRGG